MRVPFTAEQFFDVFRRYNEAVWPAQIALIVLALFIAYSAWRANARGSWRFARLALALLAALWLWTGIVYDKQFFAALTPAGAVFGSLFIAQAGLLLVSAWQDASTFERAPRPAAITGAVILAYALLLYPAIGVFLGHEFPAAPSFGTPCPTTLFTFGIFCLLPSSIPRFTLAIPVLWSFIASYPAVQFGMTEDFGLLAAAVAAIVVIHHAPHRPHAVRLAV
jgi:hypothetical protein